MSIVQPLFVADVALNKRRVQNYVSLYYIVSSVTNDLFALMQPLCFRRVFRAVRQFCPSSTHGLFPHQHLCALFATGRSLLGRILDQSGSDVRPNCIGWVSKPWIMIAYNPDDMTKCGVLERLLRINAYGFK